MIPNEKMIEEIAEFLEANMNCYFNHKTGEIINIPNFDNWMGDVELWDDVLQKIDDNAEDFVYFTGLESHEDYKIMVDFAEQIDNEELRDKLSGALEKRNPFRNFRADLDYSGDYLEQWYAFKKMRYIDKVKSQMIFKT